MRPRLVLADDHTLMIEGMRRLLASHAEIVGSARDGRTLLKVVQEVKPDIVLLDISMPLLNGIDAARQIKRLSPNTKLIFLTMHADRDYVIEAFRAGASGYLLKSSAEEELIGALSTVLRGRPYVTHELPEEFQDLPLKRSTLRAEGPAGLSSREREVLQLVAEGRSAKEIATILYLSVKTVEYHKYRLMKKLGLHSAAELATYAVQKTLLGLGLPSDRQKRPHTQ
jgi:DNA-binding NarL/FixJ family response regulator